jgi:hypothetical protein
MMAGCLLGITSVLSHLPCTIALCLFTNESCMSCLFWIILGYIVLKLWSLWGAEERFEMWVSTVWVSANQDELASQVLIIVCFQSGERFYNELWQFNTISCTEGKHVRVTFPWTCVQTHTGNIFITFPKECWMS